MDGSTSKSHGDESNMDEGTWEKYSSKQTQKMADFLNHPSTTEEDKFMFNRFLAARPERDVVEDYLDEVERRMELANEIQEYCQGKVEEGFWSCGEQKRHGEMQPSSGMIKIGPEWFTSALYAAFFVMPIERLVAINEQLLWLTMVIIMSRTVSAIKDSIVDAAHGLPGLLKFCELISYPFVFWLLAGY